MEMELSLSLGDASKPFGFLGNNNSQKEQRKNKSFNNGGLDFCMDLRLSSYEERKEAQKSQENREDEEENSGEITPVQLNLLPLSSVPHRISSHLWSSDNGSSENGSSANICLPAAKGLDVRRLLPPPSPAEEASSANSVGSIMYRNGNLLSGSKRDFEGTGNDVVEADRTSSKASDDDENGLNTRKKLRLSKEQSAFLEESFKEHSTLNPKQKLALAKQLNLRPRQVEVWFQNRRARTKLKQTEVDCEYLKRCCETLTEENRRLQKELQELRALKTSHPFYMQSPATTLTMCPSCERVASTTTAAASQPRPPAAANGKTRSSPFAQTRPRFYPFSQTTPHPNQPAAS